MIRLIDCEKVYINNNIGLKKVNLVFPKTGFISIYGKSGSGKSTLINCIGGLDRFSSGKMFLNDELVEDVSSYSTYIFQEYKLIEEITVIDNLKMAFPNSNMEKIDSLLNQFEIIELKNHKVNAISGGQRQRVEIVRALLQDASIILCDEAIANLDESNKNIVLDILKLYSKSKLVLFITHEIGIVKNYEDYHLLIEEHQVVENTIKVDNSLDIYQKCKTKKMTNKMTLILAINNIKNNIFKTIMTFTFLFLSLTMLAILFTIYNMQLSDLFYSALEENNVSNIVLSPFNEERTYPDINLKVSDTDIEIMDADIVVYDCIFGLSYKEEIIHISEVLELKKISLYDVELLDNEFLIASKLFYSLKSQYDINIGDTFETGDIILTLKGIIDEDAQIAQSTILVNSKTISLIDANMQISDGIRYEIKGEFNEVGIANLLVYNPYIDKSIPSLKSGRYPVKEFEICIPTSYLSYYNLNENNCINENIYISLISDNGTEIKEFTIVGLTNTKTIIYEGVLFSYLSSYGNQSLAVSNRKIMMLSNDKNIIKKALDINLCVVSDYTDEVLFIYNMLNSFLPLVLGLGIIFGIISIFTIFNNTNTSIIQNKKNIGVFISFKITKTSITKIYWLENILICFAAALVSFAFYPIIIGIINHLLIREWLLSFNFLHFDNLVILIMLFTTSLVMFLGLLIPFKNLIKKQPIDILYER